MKHHFQMAWIFVILFDLFLVFVVPVYAAPSVFDWGVNSWPDTSTLTHTFPNNPSPATNFAFSFTGNTTRLLSNISPQTNTIITGGTGERTLFIDANYETKSESIVLTIDLDPHAVGVSFTLMDIDTNTDGFNTLQNEVLVTGSGSVSGVVTPTLTATNSNNVTVTDNVATSTGTLVGNDSSDGNVLVDFGTAAVNQIVIVFRPGPDSSSNPYSSGIALHDIYFTPSTPTAVSLQSFQAQAPDIVAPVLLASTMIAGFTVVWAVQRRRQLKKVVKPAPIRPTHTP